MSAVRTLNLNRVHEFRFHANFDDKLDSPRRCNVGELGEMNKGIYYIVHAWVAVCFFEELLELFPAGSDGVFVLSGGGNAVCIVSEKQCRGNKCRELFTWENLLRVFSRIRGSFLKRMNGPTRTRIFYNIIMHGAAAIKCCEQTA